MQAHGAMLARPTGGVARLAGAARDGPLLRRRARRRQVMARSSKDRWVSIQEALRTRQVMAQAYG